MADSGNRRITAHWRIGAALFPGLLLGAAIMWLTEPVPQPLIYHEFADTRTVHHIRFAGDVITNLAFLISGVWGLWYLHNPKRLRQSFIDVRERRLFQWFYAGVCLTGLGSAWYHLQPDNYRLVWDRLPMAVVFMSVLAIMVAERVKASVGIALLKPLVVVGIASVLWWIWTEHAGQGDLRGYLIVQFYPVLTLPLMLLFLNTPYSHGSYYWTLFFLYSAAKLVEIFDHEIFSITQGIISGHNLKHLFAAAGAASLLRMLWLRYPLSPAKK